MRKIYILLLTVLLFTSCIPKKDLVYFQGQPVSNSEIKNYSAPYKLQVNDILDIRIKAADENLVKLFSNTEGLGTQSAQVNENALYFSSYSVNINGSVRIPYLGEVNVLGFSTKEVREKVENKLKEYFKNTDDVFVTVKLAGVRFTVLGEVNNPGTHVLFQNQVNIVEAIANAGDVTITGNRKRVMILRKNNQETRKIVINLLKANSLNSESFYIQPNDMIYVEPLKQKSWGTGETGVKTLTTIVSIVSLVASAVLITKSL